jgi:hypothetical protein
VRLSEAAMKSIPQARRFVSAPLAASTESMGQLPYGLEYGLAMPAKMAVHREFRL